MDNREDWVLIRRIIPGLLATLGCGVSDRADVSFPDAIDRTIYQVVFDSLYVPRVLSLGAPQTLLLDSTDPYPQDSAYAWVFDQFRRMSGVDSGLVHSFKARNQASHSLAAIPIRQFRGRIVLVDGDSLPSAHIETPGGWFWPAFRAKFPRAGGYMSVSAIGYNDARDLAILAVDYRGRDGSGEVTNIAVRATGGRWRIVASEVMRPRVPAT